MNLRVTALLLSCVVSVSHASVAQQPARLNPQARPEPAGTSSVAAGAASNEQAGVQVSAEAGKGFTIRRLDDSFSTTIKARVQIRNTLSYQEEWMNEINVRTLRLYILGHVLNPELRYFVQLALGPNDFDSHSPTPIFDAYVEYGKLRDATLRIGQYFVPFDRARTIREFALQLVDRQQVISELNLDRDVGAMLYSQDLFGLDGKLAYNVGVFGGGGRNRIAAETPGLLYVGRFSYRPFGKFDDDSEGDLLRLARPRLALGIAVAYNDNTPRQRGTTGNAFAGSTFDYRHGAFDVVLKYHGLSFLGEALFRKAAVNSKLATVEGVETREWSRSGYGYLLQAGMMVTEQLEIAARYDQLFAFKNTDPALVRTVDQQGRELGGGVNYYVNGHFFKIQADYSGRIGDGSETPTHAARLQLDASF